jgi:EAL domain-containing protein (putative c-di-GMP-specific phosphodiesterase class I)
MAIVRAIIAVAHALDMQVTAEGIETPEQLTHLRALGCRIGQGYLFEGPITAAAAEGMLEIGDATRVWR